jgi:predicted transcriptional regulator
MGGMTTTEISGIFGRHKSSAELQRALGVLQSRGLVSSTREQTSGAPIVIWTAAAKKAN